MSAPLLTVIVPAYNSEDYLDRALTTLVGYGDELEAIIVNTGRRTLPRRSPTSGPLATPP